MDNGADEVPRRALVVFHGVGWGFWPWLCGRPGFRHCFVALSDGRAWIEVDARGDGLRLTADVPALGITLLATHLKSSSGKRGPGGPRQCQETRTRCRSDGQVLIQLEAYLLLPRNRVSH